ncbi:HAMP domain-containing histidine kinase [Vibrio brasiliensis]|uniref:sensor histidine kinase n=1 Tax=Vibrio brasiliensis TaxID=170652 RepID=UPI001EFE5211|nr:HAMP domain-containing sensor histidine kinase [Vibrio brasiliensis]MCG9648913.1 HAMP domain-containing histidine kinase [Vibrio brasiliensis]
MQFKSRPRSMFACLYTESLIGLIVTFALFMHFGSHYLRQGDIETFVGDGVNYAQHYVNSRYEPQGLYTRLNQFQHLTFYDYTLSLESDLDPNKPLCANCTLYLSSQGVKVYMDEDELLHTALPIPNSKQHMIFREIEDPFIAATPWYQDREIHFMLCLFFTMSIALGLLIYLPLYRVNKRINRLIKIQQRFGGGELGIRADDYHISPISEITHSFNNMADDIERLVKQGQVFSHAIPHEVRTPLSKIQMACDLVQRDDCPDKKQLFNDIDDYIQDISSLTTDIHQLSKLTNKSDTSTERLDTAELPFAQFCLGRLQMMSSADNQFYIDDGIENDQITVPVTLAKLVLDNLFKNADRYGNGVVVVRLCQHQTYWTVSVEDNGCGVPEDKRDEIFLAFSRLDKSRNANNGGFGLGLAIADNAARLLNWTIDIGDSELGGARFTVFIPTIPE